MNKITALALSFCCISGSLVAADAPAAAETAPAAAATKPARPTLELGMTGEQIVEIVGKPNRVKKIKQDGLDAEVWYYTFDKPVNRRQVATSTRDVPYFDPLFDRMKMMKEMVFSQETTYLEETTELLMINGMLAQSKRYRQLRKDRID